MKKIFTILLAFAIATGIFSQTPEKMSYQAVVRDAADELIKEQVVGMQISILQGSASGTAVYVETQAPTTNSSGLVSIEIGAGTVVSGDFATIDLANGPYFIKTETDPLGGTSYTVSGTDQLLGVPYALHANTANDPRVRSGTQTGEMQYWDGSAWVTGSAGDEGQFLSFRNGEPVWVTLAGAETLGATDVYNSTTGEIWMDRNLGASQLATSATDAAAYGALYQWGRGTDGHEIRTSGISSTLSDTDTPGHGNFITVGATPYDWRNPQNDNLWQGVSGTNNPCPSGYRLPTETEWEAERLSWSSNDAAGAFASPLKLTVAGSRNYSDGSLIDVGSNGYYWSGTVDVTDSRYLGFSGSDAATMYSYYRASGFSVRCIKD